MTKMVRKTRLRSVISATIAFAMIMSMVVMPAFANPWPAETKAALTDFAPSGTNLTNDPGNYANPGINGTMEVSIPATTYVPTTGPSVDVTFTPDNGGKPYNLVGQLGYYGSTGGDLIDRFVVGPNATHDYTGLRITGRGWENFLKPWRIQFYTGGTNLVKAGTVSFKLVDGQRYRAQQPTFPHPTISPNGVVAASVNTYTVNVPSTNEDPYGVSQEELGMQDAVDGVRVLYPKDFAFSGSVAPTATAVGGNTIQTSQTVDASTTEFGPLVTVKNIYWQSGQNNLPIETVLQAPTASKFYGGADGVKVWVHQVGSPADLWIPIFCVSSKAPQGTPPPAITVGAGVLDSISADAELNRAGGYTEVNFTLLDKYKNEISPLGNIEVGFNKLADGAFVWREGFGNVIWNLGDTVGVNTITGTYTQVQPDSTSITKTVTKTLDTTNVGAPTQVKVIPTADASGTPQMTWEDGSMPHFYLQLQDKDGNPTSYLDTLHGTAAAANPTDNPGSPHMFKATGLRSVNSPLNYENLPIYQGWSRSSSFGAAGLPDSFDFSTWGDGPDTWTLTARSNGGLLENAAFTTIQISAPVQENVGVPYGIKVSAVTTAPADYADGDSIYNNNWAWGLDNSAFGYAKGDGSEAVAFTAQIVDRYNNPVALGNVDVRFDIPQFPGQNGTLISATGANLGHDTVVKTGTDGTAAISMKAYRPTLATFASSTIPTMWPEADNTFRGDQSWFTQLYADAEIPTRETVGVAPGTDWAHPCLEMERGYGFGYFHGGVLGQVLEQTKEGRTKYISLADGTDSVTYTALVTDPAFDTPVADWDVNFTTSFGYLNNIGTTAVPTKTGADGTVSVKAYSGSSGLAWVAVQDRQLDRLYTPVDFTDWKVVTKILDDTMPAGDRATATIQSTFVNIKDATKRIQWNANSNFSFGNVLGVSHDDKRPNVFGYQTDGEVVETNSTSYAGPIDTDVPADGKYDAMNFTVPAKDVVAHTGYPLESAGKRYALLEGYGEGTTWVGNIFYNEFDFVAAAERPIPEENFVKTASLQAEGTMWDEAFSVKGSGFTPGTGAPDYTDTVNVYLGDFTSEASGLMTPDNWLGEAYVQKDGTLLPSALWNDAYQTSLAPGQYNISVDGLVFKNGLTIKNLFGEASIQINEAQTNGDWGYFFVDPIKSYPLIVNAFGMTNTQVYMTKADGTQGPALTGSNTTGIFTLDVSKLRKAGYYMWDTAGGAWTATAQTLWPSGYKTVNNAHVWIRSALTWAKPSFWHSGRTLKVSGTFMGRTEADGQGALNLKVNVQRYYGGKWHSYSTKYITGTPTWLDSTRILGESYNTTVKVKKAGTYRVVVSHADVSHLTSSVTTKTLKIK